MYDNSLQRLRLTGKGRWPLHDLHFHGKGHGYYWEPPKLTGYTERGEPKLDHEPLCGHGLPAKLYRSSTENENQGKYFLRCQFGRDSAHDCQYFYWIHELPQRLD